MTAEKVYQIRQGPIQAAIHAEGAALALFKTKHANNLVRLSLTAGGRAWIEIFLPKRFSAYANSIGYRVSQKWREIKERATGSAAIPFLGLTPPGGGPVAPRWTQRNGAKMMPTAIRGARAAATATSANARVVITIPYGHAVQAETSAMFRNVPSWEVDRVAEIVGAHLQNLLDGLLPAVAVTAPKPRMPHAPAVRATGIGERGIGGGMSRKVG